MAIESIKSILTGKQGDATSTGAIRADENIRKKLFNQELVAALNPNIAFTNGNTDNLPGLLNGNIS